MAQSDFQLRRRTVLGGAVAAAGIAGVSGALPAGMAEALAEPSRRGSLDDVKHVVVLMQENRSFDHYYGTMAGVRGFGDTAALRLPTGKDVFHQPDLLRVDGGNLLPFHVDTKLVDGQDLGDLDHGWNGTHQAWNKAAYDNWIPSKSAMTMSYFTRDDIPFHRALAGAFTICDNYFCSIQGPTTPNRLYHWTGMIDPAGEAGGPATFNPDDYKPVYQWTTYPERLQAAGVSWQVYANDEVGDGGGEDGYVGDYGDNPLWLFQAYHDALASTDPKKRQLAERASLRAQWKAGSGQGRDTDHVLAQFIADCKADKLPSVSWVVAPYAYSEHPAARPVDGAAYTQRVLEALWANPKLWESTVVLLNYDENDGFFDHVVPPTANPGTPGELLSATGGLATSADGSAPIGLGPRVPMTVISPWSRGGWVNSQVFDHTSVLRFLEKWTGVHEPNISAWRREICGDLTSCFDFREHDTSIPTLPDADALRTQADATQSKLPKPAPPASGKQVTPVKEPGTAKARPLPYQPLAGITAGSGSLQLTLENHGSAALQLASYAYHLGGASQRFDVQAGGKATGEVSFTSNYDVAIHGPNGFVVEAAGSTQTAGVEAKLTLSGSGPKLQLHVTNSGAHAVSVAVSGRSGCIVPAHGSHQFTLDPLSGDHGWYDVTVTIAGQRTWRRRFAGHLENGKPSRTS
ncbi:MAG: phospholipase phosphocholine-specific [Amycolatopsis sp.]|jgi:phospholipase C|uniref:phosphocholine-specific phospholipase C n=1 Tax=Amycolatopsis sp. TaxID=37632 RepID=UPI00261128B7|nr:phospholipase C, phosphocholine-specific [Amycolatopsis sp.]MCU1684170.1 phospholipase phosphocholine-specific [Amycolatopsis sp.]